MLIPKTSCLFKNPFATFKQNWKTTSTKAAPGGNLIPVGKLEKLRELLRSYESCLVAYSGGVDSVFLALVAHQELGARSLAAIADSPSLPRRELEEALEVARNFGFPVRVVRTNEFANSDYLQNPAESLLLLQTRTLH